MHSPASWLEPLLEEYGIDFSRINGYTFEERMGQLQVPEALVEEMGELMRKYLNHTLPWTGIDYEGSLLRGYLEIDGAAHRALLRVFEHDRERSHDPLELLMELNT